ncbi:hypothetical protein PR048_022557 [Dryococelus australis]|uniref:Uncharacterized protein n=1 Tax=Dryococelus australis TaxID=614101 RepID=A0ABQ9H1D9_9NEOP|nr:hypothetical protein PR048_022557 [Dryococelus australis]
MAPDKIAPIINLSQPKNVNGIMTFLGMIVYFKKFIAEYAALLCTSEPAEGEAREFDKLKHVISHLILRLPNFNEKVGGKRVIVVQLHLLLELSEMEQAYSVYENEALGWSSPFSHPRPLGKIGCWIIRLTRFRLLILHMEGRCFIDNVQPDGIPGG